MQRIVDPKQTRLFDPFDSVLTEKTRKRWLEHFAGIGLCQNARNCMGTGQNGRILA